MQENTTKHVEVHSEANTASPDGCRRSNAELQRLQRLANLGLLSASMVHELKNAMVGVRTFVHLLLEKHPDADLAELARRELGRIDNIVSHALRYASPAPAVATLVAVNQAMEFSLRLVYSGLQGKAILVHKYFRAQPDLVRAAEGKLHQVFVNLLLNSIDAMSQQGTLVIETDVVRAAEPLAAATVRIRLRDDGKGLPLEGRERIFEPFFTTKPDGTGLGLTITKEIVEEFGGSIRAESEPGHGTTFEILLPASMSASA